MRKIFDLVAQYALSKTLRFEIKPSKITRQNLETQKILIQDTKKQKAYQELKPLFDALHNKFIAESLENSQINWESYFDHLKAKKSDFSDSEKKKWEKDFEKIEKNLREEIGKLYEKTAERWKLEINENPKKPILKDKSYKILTESGILKVLKKIFPDKQEFIDEFEWFFTYFSGFNQNRENYYTTKEEKSTAIATRIVHENLPKFVANREAFKKHEEKYLEMYDKLNSKSRQIRDKKTGEMINISAITEDIFEIPFFNRALSQAGIDDYNRLIGHYNELINLYNQEFGEKLPLFKILYKQIGSLHEKWFEIFQIENANHLKNILQNNYFPECNQKNEQILQLFQSLEKHENLKEIYLSKIAINTISAKFFSNWFAFAEILKNQKIWKMSSEWQIEATEYTSLADILEALKNLKPVEIFKNWEDEKNLQNLWSDNIFLKKLIDEVRISIENTQKYEWELHNILKNFSISKKNDREILKKYADESRIPAIMAKYFLAKKMEKSGIDAEFYNELHTILEDYKIVEYYDAIRNFITKKLESPEKMKLNFENGTLAGGWDVNKEVDNSCILLKNEKDEEFLAIMSRGNNHIFEKEIGTRKQKMKNPLYENVAQNGWKKMEYKLLPWPNKMLPKCLFPKSNRKQYGATDEILAIYDEGLFKKWENFSKEALHKIIDFYKQGIQLYENWQVFGFQFKKTEEYEDISQFYADVEKQGYKLDFVPINGEKLLELEREWKIFLFQIKNQDYNEKPGKSQKNLHTLYWKNIFENVPNRVKLNGEAEIFYRKAYEPTFKKGENGNEILNKKGEKIIDKLRFTREKFLFHVPVTLNFCMKNTNINEQVREIIIQNPDITFLGIDRGEKHLLYYSLIDRNGNIIEQWSLNCIGKTNYAEKLTQVANNRDEARKNWQTIGKIKELKEWYISHAVKKIVDLSIQHNALIIMEDLNTGFKRSRQKIEKSIYQKFELALAQKLNFVVMKDALQNTHGSVNQAYQLTPKIDNYGDIEAKKQVGIIFYTRANYTSQTDPATGWRKSIYLKKGTENTKNGILENFSDIIFENGDFIFSYTDKNTGKHWELHSQINGENIERYYHERNKETGQWENSKVNINNLLLTTLENFDFNRSILSQIDKWVEPKSWEKLRFAIEMIQQIRNTGMDAISDDFLLSPVQKEQWEHFDSRKFLQKIQNELVPNSEKFPTSGDANGAYNIARKGIIMIERIIKYNKTLNGKVDLLIRDIDWDMWLLR